MIFQTHIILGIVLFILTRNLFGGGNEIIFFLLVLLGAILPDIDSKNSKINKWSGIVGIIATFFAKHRGIFHSVLFHLALFFVLIPLIGVYYASGLFLGYLAHFIGDGVTKAGLAPLYPLSLYKIKGPLKVGGIVEGIILILLFTWIVLRFI